MTQDEILTDLEKSAEALSEAFREFAEAVRSSNLTWLELYHSCWVHRIAGIILWLVFGVVATLTVLDYLEWV